MDNQPLEHRNHVLATLIIVLGACFYFYEFAVRVAPSVLTQQLMQAFHLNAASISAMASLFYLAYVLMQVPSGLLYDRFGPRFLLTGAICLCAFGTLLFAVTSQAWLLSVGRFLTGFGGAFAFIGVLVLASSWFPAKYFGLIAGVVQFLGSIGALAGEGPLSAATDHFGWRPTLVGLFWIGLVVAVLVFLIVRDRPTHLPAPKQHKLGAGEWQRLRSVLSQPQTWVIALYNFSIWTPMIVFPALWGISYIRDLYAINTTQAANMVELVWLGVAVGSPLFGWWSQRLQRRKLPLMSSAVIGLVAIIIILFVPVPQAWMYPLMIVFGLGASGQSLAFAVVKDINVDANIGTAVSVNNLATVLGGVFVLPIVGLLIKWDWNGRIVHGIPIYTLSEYRHSMYVIPVTLIIALFVSLFWLKETKAQPTY